MKAEILYIIDCPNSATAGVSLRDALDATGHPDVLIDFRLLTTSEEAAAFPFAGSPTILLDGVDAFPTGARITDLACRVYRSGQGPAGVPSADEIADVIRERAENVD